MFHVHVITLTRSRRALGRRCRRSRNLMLFQFYATWKKFQNRRPITLDITVFNDIFSTSMSRLSLFHCFHYWNNINTSLSREVVCASMFSFPPFSFSLPFSFPSFSSSFFIEYNLSRMNNQSYQRNTLQHPLLQSPPTSQLPYLPLLFRSVRAFHNHQHLALSVRALTRRLAESHQKGKNYYSQFNWLRTIRLFPSPRARSKEMTVYQSLRENIGLIFLRMAASEYCRAPFY